MMHRLNTRCTFMACLMWLPAIAVAATNHQVSVDCNGSMSGGDDFSTTLRSVTTTCSLNPVSQITTSASIAESNLPGVVSGRSSLNYSNLNNLRETFMGSAITAMNYFDLITVDIPGLADNADVTVRVTMTLDGGNIVNTAPTAQIKAAADLDVSFGGRLATIQAYDFSDGSSLPFNFPTYSWETTVKNRVATSLSIRLETSVSAFGINQISGDGSAVADFISTGGITGFEYYDLDGNSLTGDYTSRDGFTFYNPVPIPAAAWLFISGLLGLIGFARHKKIR